MEPQRNFNPERELGILVIVSLFVVTPPLELFKFRGIGRGCIRIGSELHPNRNSCLACSYSLHIHPRDSEPACLARGFLLLYLLTIYTCKSVIFSQGFLSAARESYAHRNTMSISAEEPHDLYFRVKLLTRPDDQLSTHHTN